MSTSACHELFAYTARRLIPQDIADFCPGDPGYGGYVETFNTILRTRLPPVIPSVREHCDISETLGLTWTCDAEAARDPTRYRRARLFANAAAACLYTGPYGDSDLAANCLAITLLDDAWALQDAALLALLPAAYAELHRLFLENAGPPEESPFFLLAQLILAFLGHAPSVNPPQLAAQLIAEAPKYNVYGASNFLWCCSDDSRLFHRWRHFIELSFPRQTPHDDIALLRDELLGTP